MAKTYITNSNDTWDLIAYKTLGSEYLLPILLEENQQYRNTIIFPGGIKLSVPDIDTSIYVNRPSWLGEDEEL